MRSKFFFKLLISCFLLIWAPNGFAINEDSAKEQSCFEIKKTVPIDTNWFASIKTGYYTYRSRLDLYRIAKAITDKDFGDINESELYYDSCFEFSPIAGGVEDRGFRVAKHNTPITPVDPNLEVSYFGDEKKDGFYGKCYTTMTDNKSFAFQACCTTGNEMTWTVASLTKMLPNNTVQAIYEHATELGFKKEYFAHIRYETCD